jgi:hypothetical protein
MQAGPIRLGLAPRARRRAAAHEQQRLQRRVGQPLRQRPAQPGRHRLTGVVAHRAAGQARAARNRRSLSPSALSRNISLTLRIGTLSAGIGSSPGAGRGAYAVQPEIKRPPPTGWPTSNRKLGGRLPSESAAIGRKPSNLKCLRRFRESLPDFHVPSAAHERHMEMTCDRAPRRGVADGRSVRRFRAGAGSIRRPQRAARRGDHR